MRVLKMVRSSRCLMHTSRVKHMIGRRDYHHAIPIPNPNCFSSSSSSSSSSYLKLKVSRLALAPFPLQSLTFPSCCRPYSSFFGSKAPTQDTNTIASSSSSSSNSDALFSSSSSSEWIEGLKHGWQSALDALQKAQDQLIIPYLHQLLHSHPYIGNYIVPVASTFTATVLAWWVMPRVLRKLHAYSIPGPVSLLFQQQQIPYEKSLWAALEDPIRYLVTFMALSQLALLIAPTTIASHYITQASRASFVLSFLWFLHRWKTNVFARALASHTLSPLDRDKLLALDKLSSLGLLVLGFMASAEASGVAVHSVLTLGGIGGVATAFAARDILGNLLSGLSLQFSKPFSLGDTIKAGSIEGQVVEMGLTTTSLINAEKYPVLVPNSLFSSQAIINKSRAGWHGFLTKIPLRIDNLEMIDPITEDIKSMLNLNSKIFLEKEAPYCFLSRIEKSFAELTLGCNLKQMSKEELYSTKQDILLEASRIIKEHGVELGNTI